MSLNVISLNQVQTQKIVCVQYVTWTMMVNGLDVTCVKTGFVKYVVNFKEYFTLGIGGIDGNYC